MGLFKRILFILGVFCFLLLFFIPQNLYSEDTGYKYFKNYSYKDYDHHAQNWGIAQAKNGIIYVANQAGVLEFDGVSWRVIYKDIPNFTVHSIDIDYTGTIYIGGKDEIGCLIPDEKGALHYESLLDYIEDENLKKFSNVWSTHAAREGIYFRTSKFLFRWHAGHKKIKVWQASSTFNASFLCNGNLFVQQDGTGLMQLMNDSLTLIPGGEIFAEAKNNYRIFIMTPYDSVFGAKKLLIGTRLKGFFLYNGITVEPLRIEIDDDLMNKRPSFGTRLSSGDFAFATFNGGLVITDSHGYLRYIFDKTFGLQDENVKYVLEDNYGNLWLALNNGISKLEYKSPFFYFDDRNGLPGMVLSVVRHDEDIYAGTSRGLFVLSPSSKAFRPVPGIAGNCWSLLSTDRSLLAATTNGVFQVDYKNHEKRTVLKGKSFILLPSARDSHRTWCGTSKGLATIVRKNNLWIEEYRFENVKREIRYIAEDRKGQLWLVTATGEVLKVDFSIGIDHPLITWYETSHGLPGGRVFTTTAADHVIFATDKGIFRFDHKKDLFIPDQTLGNRFAGGPNSKPVFRFTEDQNKNIWFHSESRNYQAVPEPGGTYTNTSKPLRRIPLIQVNVIYPDPDGVNIWFGSVDGLIRYDKRVKKNYDFPFQTLIRKVWVNRKLVFAGFTKNGQGKKLITVVDYKDRNFRFEFSAPFFDAESETTYQCLLEGYDKEWTSWSKETWKDYTNIDSGMNTFRVRARNVYGTISNEAIYIFRVLAPWYKTWWAFSFYAFAAFLGVYFTVKWRSWKLVKEKQRLEKIVKERTVEISEKNLQLQEQSEKLKEMDKIKSRFFANISHEFRTPLTLIMSPLEQMLSNSPAENQENTFKVMLRNSRRLLTLINQLLDLSRFDSGKMKLHASKQNIVPFLKGILASFHILARENKLKLEFLAEEEDIPLYFDAQKLEEAINNLLINAVKFTPPGREITVSVSLNKHTPTGRQNYPVEVITSQDQDFVTISVSDTGKGIPKEQLGHIFDRFYQVENRHEKNFKGTGIGLAITKEIILLHHGKIDVHSQEGRGTEFVIQLPIGDKHLEPQDIGADPEMTVQPKEDKKMQALYTDDMEVEGDGIANASENHQESKHETTSLQTPGEAPGAQEKDVILVVEDHIDMRRHIKESLDPFYTVVETEDGKQGIEKAKEIIPDLIVSDIMMPEVDGVELCRELKSDIKTSHVPIVLLTARASEESIIEGLETGADDYITKPFNPKILLSRIRNLIELRSHLQQKIQKQMLLQPTEISVSSMDQEFIKELHDVIEKNLTDPEFHVEQLSKKLYMDRTTLYRKIKALSGDTPTEYIRSYRLKRAAQLLRGNFGTVSQVASEVGFSNMAYFAQCFKEKFQQLPSTYQASESK